MPFGKPTSWTDEMLDRAFTEIERRLVELESGYDEEPQGETVDPREVQLRDMFLAFLPRVLATMNNPPAAAGTEAAAVQASEK